MDKKTKTKTVSKTAKKGKASTKENTTRFDRFIDGFIDALKISCNSDLFLGIFIIIEGLCLLIAPSFFSVCVVIGTVIGFTWLIELAFDIIRGRKKVQSVLQQFCLVFILLIAGFAGILMLLDERLMLNVDRIAVCVTTIIDGFRNLIDINKSGKRFLPLLVFGLLNLVYINYGLIYLFIGGDGLSSFFTTGMHGVVFIFMGLTDLWFYFGVSKTRRIKSSNEM
jgi:hypothetical protein